MLCNAHVRSQIKESVQMLATAHYMLGLDSSCVVPPTHRNHPATKWVMGNRANYEWLFEHYKALLAEYKHRHGVEHHYVQHIPALEMMPNGIEFQRHYATCPPAIVTEDLKPKHNDWASVVEAYRAYYNREKRHLHHWMVRDKPDWITEPVTEEGTSDGTISPG